jgi:hypothetical protein
MLARKSVGLALLSFLLGGGGLLFLLGGLFGSPEGFPVMGVSDGREDPVGRDGYSSGPGLRNSMLASSYGRRQAGQRPFMLLRTLW